MPAQAVNLFFAIIPLVLFIVVLLVVYFAKRGEDAVTVTPGKTFSCARCGRRGAHEHMLPVTREGAVVWYCDRCAKAG